MCKAKQHLFVLLFRTYIQGKNQMANITIPNLCPAGADLFDSSESYLQELSDIELLDTNGGLSPLVAGFIIGVAVGVSASIALTELAK
jgi:lactobin A/cerein 7B family class IIb bacteriocin